MEHKAENTLKIILKTDDRRLVECWHFTGETTTHNTEKFIAAHNDAYDMFLCEQPLLILPTRKPLPNRTPAFVSVNAELIKPKHVTPPYSEFMLNTHAIDIIDGETINEKIAELAYLESDEKALLTIWLRELESKGLYIIRAC